MPLATQVVRDGAPLRIRWGGFHVAAIALAALVEHHEQLSAAFTRDLAAQGWDGEQPVTITPALAHDLADYSVMGLAFPAGEYTLAERHAFVDSADGEVFVLEPGDVLKAWRMA